MAGVRDAEGNESIMERVMRIERERAAAGRKHEVAMRPASYKSSLSLAMPVGTTRQKEKRELVTD